MDENGKMKRRGFLKTAAAGAALGAAAKVYWRLRKPGNVRAQTRFHAYRHGGPGAVFPRHGLYGCDQRSHGSAADEHEGGGGVGREDGYAGSVRGADEWKKKRIDELKGF